MIQVSNNPYGDTLTGFGSRPRLDTNQIGVVSLVVDGDRGIARFLAALATGRPGRYDGLTSWSAPTFEVCFRVTDRDRTRRRDPSDGLAAPILDQGGPGAGSTAKVRDRILARRSQAGLGRSDEGAVERAPRQGAGLLEGREVLVSADAEHADDRMERKEPKRRIRRTFVTLLIVLTAIGVAASTTAVWAHQVIFDTDQFVETVGPLIDDPDVQDALATRLTEAIMTGLDVENRVESTLAQAGPEDLPISVSVLAGPITDGIRDFLHDRIQQLLASDAARTVWLKSVTFAHEEAIAILRGESSTITIQGDTAYLNLLPLVNDALTSLEGTLSDLLNRPIDIPPATGEAAENLLPVLEQRLGVDLPDDFGQIPVFSSSSLEAAQQAVKISDRLVWLLIIVTAVTAIAALALSPRRLRTLMWLGFASAIALIVARRATIRFQEDIVNLAPDGANRGAVSDTVSRVLGDLRGFTTLLLVSTIVIALLAYLAGRPSWLTRAIDRKGEGSWLDRENVVVRWIAGHAHVLRIVSVVIVALLLLFTDVSWAAFGIVLVLLVAWLVVLSALQQESPVAPEA